MTSVLQKGRAEQGMGLRPQAALRTHTSYVSWTNTEAFTSDDFKVIKKESA